MSHAPEDSLNIAMGQRILATSFGLHVDAKLAAWFMEELVRTAGILPAALEGEASLFDVRTRQFDALVSRNSK